MEVDQNYTYSMDMPRDIAQKRKTDVDEQVGAAAGDNVHAYGWHWSRALAGCVKKERKECVGAGG